VGFVGPALGVGLKFALMHVVPVYQSQHSVVVSQSDIPTNTVHRGDGHGLLIIIEDRAVSR
jgi:hypothetical protein